MELDINDKKQELTKSVLKSTDEETDISAIRTPYHHLGEEDIVRFMECEAAAGNKIECLLNEYLDEAGRPLPKRKAASKKKEVFDINKYA